MRSLVYMTILLATLASVVGCSGPEEKKAKFFSRGQALYEQKDYVKAGLELKNALQIDPKFADGYYLLGMVELKQGGIKQAMGHFGKATELDPGQLDAQLQLGKIFLGARLPDKAAEKAELVLKTTPDHQDALLLKSAVLLAQKQYAEAREILDKLALRSDCREPDVYLLLATIAQQQGNVVAAYDAVAKGLEKMPDAGVILLKKAEIEQQMGNLAEAAGLVRQILEKEPENKRLPILLAGLLMANDNAADADQVIEKYVADKPDEEERWLQAAQFYVAQKQVEKAENILTGGLKTHEKNARFYLAMADLALMKKEKASEVLKILENGVAAIDDAENPGTLELKNRIAQLDLQNGNLQAAEKIVDEILSVSANNIDAHFTKGTLHLMRGEGVPAVADFRVVVNERPEAESARMRLAEAHLLNRENSLALDTLQKGLEVLPDSKILVTGLARFYARQGDFDKACETLAALSKKNPEDVELQLELATYYERNKQNQVAENMLLQAAQKHPEIPAVFLQLAELRQREGRNQEARKSIAAALAAQPENGLLAAAMVKLFIQQKDQPAALDFVHKRIARSPQDAMNYNLLAEVLLAGNKLDEAKNVLEKAIELAPEWPLPYNHLADIYLAQGDTATADKTFTKAISLNPNNLGAYLALSQIRYRNGDSAGAIQLLEDATNGRPDFWQGANDLAFLLAERGASGDLDRALNLAVRAQSFKPDEASIRDTLGWIYFKKGSLDEAKRQLEAAMAKTPDSSEVNFHLGMVLFEKGDRAQARHFLEKSLAGKRDFAGRDLAEKTLGDL